MLKVKRSAVLLTKNIRNQKGMASIEIIPMVIIFALTINFSFGFFGVIHSGILSNIAARNYAFETFNHRSNVLYFRDTISSGSSGDNPAYDSTLDFNRVSGIASERRGGGSLNWIASTRTVQFVAKEIEDGHSVSNKKFLQFGERNTSEQASPVWIKAQYGMCMNPNCGG